MFLEQYRIVQAPMAGVSTPALSIAACEAGALGMVALAALSPDGAAAAMAETRSGTAKPFGVNVFCHRPPDPDPEGDAAWCAELAPHFARFGASPPEVLADNYTSFRVNDDMLAVIVKARPALVGFHFGLPRPDQIAALRGIGAFLVATATSEAEGIAAREAGIDALVAQGWQAGGHRGIHDPDGPDERLDTLPLLARLRSVGLPMIAAGGIMTAHDVQAALGAGAVAAQSGTAFLNTPEAATSAPHRAGLAAGQTVMTRAISGRPARGLRNHFTDIDDTRAAAYSRAYHAGKALHAAAMKSGETGYGAFWAGTGAALARARPAADVVASLSR